VCARLDARAIAAAPPSELARGQALYCLKLYSASLASLAGRPLGPDVFEREVESAMRDAEGRAPGRLADPETMRWLVFLARRVANRDGVVEALGPLARSDLEQPGLADVHDELCELAGRHYYQQGRFKEAIEMLRLIPAGSPVRARAALLEGAIHVREYTAKPAVDAFKEALRAAAAAGADPRAASLAELATLSLARTFYSTGQFELARKYYDLVPPSSRYRTEASFEEAWTCFMLHDHARALGLIHALESDTSDLKPEARAEALMLEAEIMLTDGNDDATGRVLTRFHAVYPALLEQVKRVIESYSDDEAMFALAARIRAGRSELPPAVERAARQVLSDRSVARRFEHIDELAREVAQLATMDPVWRRSPVGESVASGLAFRRLEAVREAGDLCRRRLKRLTEELAQLIKRSLGIQFEPLEAARGKIAP
jgi:tetratricopeptide (TPR) repeat protein